MMQLRFLRVKERAESSVAINVLKLQSYDYERFNNCFRVDALKKQN
jgi:hypothetical protein